MRFFYTFILSLAISTTGIAQITLTQSDYAIMGDAETVITYNADNADNVSFDIGGTGNGQVWDLRGYSYTPETSGSTILDPSETPYAAQFPTATLASYVKTADGEGYSYMRLDQSGFYLLGVIGMAQGQQFVLEYDPAKPEMMFPGTLGSTWNYNGNPTDLAGVATQQTRGEYEIDAAGMLQLPDGEFECLRMRSTEWQTTKVEYNGQVVSEQVTKNVSYTLMTKDGINASLLADTTSPETGMITASGISYTVFGSSTGLGDLAFSNDFALKPVYPNPLVSGAPTTVAWNMPVQGDVAVKVYDARGSEVASVYEGALNPGLHTQSISTAGFAPGAYFVRMTANGKMFTTSLAVIR